MKPIHSMNAVVRRTGLSSHVIRAWERRYGAVTPARSPGNQRVYTDQDVQRLILLSKTVQRGHSIKQIANLDIRELCELAGESLPSIQESDPPLGLNENESTGIETALDCLDSMDRDGLRKTLTEWQIGFGINRTVDLLIPTFLQEIGMRWSDGSLRIYQEHMASEVTKAYLNGLLNEFSNTASSRTVITATPPGEPHDMGAHLCAVASAGEGFSVIHLGANVPFSELIHLARERSAEAVLLSFVFHSQDPEVKSGLFQLWQSLTPESRVFIGGSASEWYAGQLPHTDIHRFETIAALRQYLKSL